MKHVFTTVYLHSRRKAHMACNLNYLVETEGHLKVTGSDMHCKMW